MGVKLRERPGKGWYVITDWKGQRKAKCFGADKKLAQAFADKLKAKLKWAEQGGETVVLSQPEQTMPMVKGYLEEWLCVYAKTHCKASTYRGYARAVRQHLLPAFGDRPLHALKREDVKRLIAQLTQRGLARGTVQNCLVPLKAAYYQAVEDGVVTQNPAARMGRWLQGAYDRRATIQPLTNLEIQTLLATAEQREPSLAPVLLCAVRTGLRMGELIGLQWGDVDFHGQFIEVRRGVVLRQVTTTKTHKIRRVDMSPQLQATLQRLKELRQIEAMNQGRQISPWVFLSPEGQRWDDRNLRRAYYRCLERAEMREVRFHDLRHTYASLMGAQGAPPKYVQEQLGHSSIQVTMDIYSHLFPNGNREWVERLDQVCGEVKSATQAQPGAGGLEQVCYKSRKVLVAVEGIEPPTRGL